MSLNDAWGAVRQFHESFRHPTSEKPTILIHDRVEKRFEWMLEELMEFKESENLAEQADAMIDLLYFVLGTLVEMGIRPQELFSIVHKANMNKLGEDGCPIYDDNGKVEKPDSWIDPADEIAREIAVQIERTQHY